MKIHFPTRDKARAYANSKNTVIIDNGPSSAIGKRWCVDIKLTPNEPRKAPVTLQKRIIVIVNAHKDEPTENIEKCFQQALDKWKDGRKNSRTASRHTAKSERFKIYRK